MLDLPAPVVDPDSAGYWELAKNRTLSAQQCSDCGAKQFPPYPCCRQCNSMAVDWAPVPSSGRIYTWTTVHRSPRPEFASYVPYTLVAVDVEGVDGRFPGLLMDPPEGHPQIGAEVDADFVEIQGGFWLPVWRSRA